MDPFSDNLNQTNADEQAFTASEGACQESAAAVEQDSSAGFKKEDGQVAICRITPDGRILKANQAFCSRLKMNEIARGSNILDYFPSTEKGLLSRRFLLAHHHQKSFHIKLFPAAATSTVALEMEMKPQHNSLYLHEISRTAVGNKVKQLPARDTVLMVEQIPLPVILYNKVHEAQYVNNKFLVFTGYNNKEEVLALQEEVLFPAQEGDLKQLFLTINDTKTPSGSTQLQLRTSSGTARWVEAVVSIIPDKELYMVVLQDLSKLKKQEKVLNERQAEMEMFMDRAFHDLKGPINSLIALYQLVEHEFEQDEEVMEYFRHYHQGITRLHRTLHNLLTLSRIQQAEPVLKPVSLPKMVEECLLSFRNLPSFYKIRFKKEIDIEEIFTEENLLRTIVQNLLENAIKYSCEKDPVVRIMACRHKKGFWLKVSDNGIGIPESLQSRVFDRFFRATTQANGSGLGLYLLREAVTRLKGEVKLQSKEEKGTTVSVFIPCH